MNFRPNSSKKLMESNESLVYQARVASQKVTGKVLHIKVLDAICNIMRALKLQVDAGVSEAIVDLNGGCLEPRNRLLHDGSSEGRSHGE